MYNKKTFKCTKCGECCRPIVKVDEKDFIRIKEAGYNDFSEYDETIKSNVLKQKKGVCIFLKRKGEEFICSIYDQRPEVCRQYPFIGREEIEDCRPPNWERWYPLKKLVKEE